MTIVAVAVAGALGAVARLVVDQAVSARASDVWPWGTLVVNLAGSFLGGVAAGLVVTGDLPARVPLVAGAGFSGAFTTFSSFAYDTVHLVQEGRLAPAAANVVATVAGSLAAAGAGLLVAAVV